MSDPYPFEPRLRTGPAERDYLIKRADDHRLLAEQSHDPEARLIHSRFSSLYQQQAEAIALVVQD